VTECPATFFAVRVLIENNEKHTCRFLTAFSAGCAIERRAAARRDPGPRRDTKPTVRNFAPERPAGSQKAMRPQDKQLSHS